MNKIMKLKGNMGINIGQPIILVIIAIIIIILMGSIFYYVSINEGYDEQYRNITIEQQLLTQRLAKAVQGIITNNANATSLLRLSRRNFDENLEALEKGKESIDLPPIPTINMQEFQPIKNRWIKVREAIDHILDSTADLQNLNDSANRIHDKIIPDIIRQFDELIQIAIDKNLSPRSIEQLGRQRVLLQKIDNNINHFLSGTNEKIPDLLVSDLKLFVAVVDGLQKGDDLRQIKPLQFQETTDKLNQIIKIF